MNMEVVESDRSSNLELNEHGKKKEFFGIRNIPHYARRQCNFSSGLRFS